MVSDIVTPFAISINFIIFYKEWLDFAIYI